MITSDLDMYNASLCFYFENISLWGTQQCMGMHGKVEEIYQNNSKVFLGQDLFFCLITEYCIWSFGVPYCGTASPCIHQICKCYVLVQQSLTQMV